MLITHLRDSSKEKPSVTQYALENNHKNVHFFNEFRLVTCTANSCLPGIGQNLWSKMIRITQNFSLNVD